MHESMPNQKTRRAMLAIEKLFIASEHGEPFREVYQNLEVKTAKVSREYEEFWERTEAQFLDFVDDLEIKATRRADGTTEN